MTTIIAIVNQKGGVGKTTTTINLAAQMADLQRSVLLLDLDPQGNASSGLAINRQVEATTLELLRGTADLMAVTQASQVENLSVVPSNSHLAGAEIELVSQPNREFALSTALSGARSDYVLIDCPPSLGLLTINALTAADVVLMPVQAEYYALEGLSQLLDTIQAVKRSTNPRLELLGIVLTMYDKRNSLSEQVRAEVQQYFGERLFKTTIPRNVRLAEAPSYGQTIFQYDKRSKGAKAYKALAKEIAKSLG
jgi:chromosome partitioning protein